MNRLFAEFLGTFFLVFAGTGAIVINHASGGAITHVGIALTFGLVVMALIYTLGDISGAHLNPAVTSAFALAGRFPLRDVPGYLIAQLAGAASASLTLRALFPETPTLGQTLPTGPVERAVIFETLLTFFLMLVILAVSSGPKERGIMAGIAVGGTVALEALFAGPITGASMNPARSLAPAVVSGQTQHLWVYLAAPTLGAALAVPAFRLLTTRPAHPAPARAA